MPVQHQSVSCAITSSRAKELTNSHQRTGLKPLLGIPPSLMIPNLLDNALLPNRLDDPLSSNGFVFPVARVGGELVGLLLGLGVGEGVEVGYCCGGVTREGRVEWREDVVGGAEEGGGA